jgi:hypothetical protein
VGRPKQARLADHAEASRGSPSDWHPMGAGRLGCEECKTCGGGVYLELVGVSTGEGIAMSNLWINWRFGVRHLQIGPDWPFITFRVNYWHVVHRPAKWFERC